MRELKDSGKNFRLLSVIYGFRGVAIIRISYIKDNTVCKSGSFGMKQIIVFILKQINSTTQNDILFKRVIIFKILRHLSRYLRSFSCFIIIHNKHLNLNSFYMFRTSMHVQIRYFLTISSKKYMPLFNHGLRYM